MSVEGIIKEALGEKCLNDYQETNLGWLSLRNSDIRIGAKFLNKFNWPTPEDEIEYLSQFAGSANISVLQSFYRACNGFRLMSDFFASPGIPYYQFATETNDYFNIPVDVKFIAGTDFPKHAPCRGFVIGVRQKLVANKTKALLSILDADGSIVSGHFRESPEVTYHHADVEQWLRSSVQEAVIDFDQYWKLNPVSG